MMKTCRISIFKHRETHIRVRLDITVLYTFFEILKNMKFRLKSQRGLGFGFTDKRLSSTKMGIKFVFQPHEAHILAWLDIMVFLHNFLRF
jgi:hypothetical protein